MALSRSQMEYLALAALAGLFLAFFIPALVSARQEIRNDLRRQDITNLKRALEQYFNEHNHYGSPPDESRSCTATNDLESWLFGKNSPLLKDQFIDAIPHDVRENRKRAYRFCPSHVEDSIITGFYLETQLEADQPDTIAFDQEEDRKFNYRVLHEDGKTLYRVCGGTETQCTPAES